MKRQRKNMRKLLLKTVDINDEIFYKLLKMHKHCVKIVNNIHDYFYGYKDKTNIYYNGKDTFVCQEYRLAVLCNIKKYTGWKQVIVRINCNQKAEIKETVTGGRAKAYMMKILKKYYTAEEIDKRLNMFQAEYDSDLKQQHYNGDLLPSGKILKFTNTYKFDINGAHLDALCEIFPKAKDDFVRMYNKRHEKPVFKEYPNRFVGCLAQKTDEMRKEHILGKYERTYNWIVQRTTEKLLLALNEVGGKQLYINTDGLVINNPESIICTSANLGEFKLEHCGNTYFYRDKNYCIFQFGEDLTKKDVLKGSCLTEVRKYIDLSKGKIVHYDRIHENGTYVAKNIKEETLEIYEEN